MSARRIPLVNGYPVASLAQGGWDNAECDSRTHHSLNKSGLFEEVTFGSFLAPSFDFGWICLQPEIAKGIVAYCTLVQDFL